MSRKDVAAKSSWSSDLVKKIAMDIGDAVIAHIEMMYPQAIAATPTTFARSVRNAISNEILAAIEVNDADEVVARIEDRKLARRRLRSGYRQMRTGAPPKTAG
jgi:hypothetical protein